MFINIGDLKGKLTTTNTRMKSTLSYTYDLRQGLESTKYYREQGGGREPGVAKDVMPTVREPEHLPKQCSKVGLCSLTRQRAFCIVKSFSRKGCALHKFHENFKIDAATSQSARRIYQPTDSSHALQFVSHVSWARTVREIQNNSAFSLII